MEFVVHSKKSLYFNKSFKRMYHFKKEIPNLGV